MGKCYIEMVGVVHDMIISCCVRLRSPPYGSNQNGADGVDLYGHDSGSKTSLYGHGPKAGPYPRCPYAINVRRGPVGDDEFV